MPPEVAARALDVVADLPRQLDRGAELLLAAQQRVEVEPHGVAVDVGVEVEDVALDRDRVVLVERRADADVRHALEAAVEALEARRGDEDAAVGIELVERIDVDGREADLAPEAAAGGDEAVDEVRASQREGDGAHGAARDALADARAGDADAADAHLVDAVEIGRAHV